MANWTKNQPAGNSNRRKWNLEDRASLNNLKYHIAAEGCSEVQYDLARQLLEKPVDDNAENHSEQAVYWLLCATQQGHNEAAKLLRQCYRDRRGITTDNETEVCCCLSMSSGELAARRAARELFACLSNGNEHITPKQLERKMRAIYNIQKKRRRPGHLTDSTSEEEEDSEIVEDDEGSRTSAMANGKVRHRRQSRPRRLTGGATQQKDIITEANLVSAAVNYAAGQMPAVNDALTLSVPHPASLDHVPCFHRLFFHPIVFLTLLYHRLITFISALPSVYSPSMRFVCLFAIYCLVSTENLSIFLPVGFYYICLGVMVWSTCKMLKIKHDFVDFRIWSGLFLSYGDNNIEADLSEQRFLRNNMKPYLYFFCAFVGNLIVCPFIASEWLPHSEVTIVSCLLVFITLLTFMYSATAHPFPDWLVLVSFGINVLAKYPYEMDDVVTTGWRFLDLKVPTFCSFVIGNGIEFCLNCRTALYLLIPGFLVHLARRAHWHGTYTHLIPHCVTLSWLQICITASQRATMFGMVRATLGLAGTLLFLPLFGIVSLLIPVFVAIEWLGFVEPSIRLGSTLITLLLALLCSCYLALNRLTQKYVTTLQVLLGLIAACVLTLPYMTSNVKDPPLLHHHPVIDSTSTAGSTLSASDLYLSWQSFYALCGSPSWEQNANKLNSQLRCAHLDGMPVVWEGTVTQVQIKRMYNSRAELMDKYLPEWLAKPLRCLLGEPVELACDKHNTGDVLMCEELQQQLAGKCSLHKWNSYEYELRLRMPPSGLLSKSVEVVLLAGDKFSNFTRHLVTGDRLLFYGNLINTRELPSGERDTCLLGSAINTYIQLMAVECRQCYDKTNPPVILERDSTKSLVAARMRDLKRGIKYLLNVLFNPLITFK